MPTKEGAAISVDLQRALNAAAGEANLDLISTLLKKGAQPDRAVGVERDALVTAGELVRQNQNKESIWPPLRAFMLMRKHVRIRDAGVKDVEGQLELALVSGAQQGVSYAQLSVTLPDGKKYPVSLSASETAYVNTSLMGRQFVVRFGSSYRLIGTIQQGTLEVDEVHLIEPASTQPQASSTQSGSTNGAMPIPLPLFHPSTSEALTPYLG